MKCSPLVLIGALAASALVSPVAASAAQPSGGINLTLSSATTHVVAGSSTVRIASVNIIQPNSHDHDSDWNAGGSHNHDHTTFELGLRATEGAFTA